ncbi:hypothetical protein, partial [Streptomyces calidiresistens]
MATETHANEHQEGEESNEPAPAPDELGALEETLLAAILAALLAATTHADRATNTAEDAARRTALLADALLAAADHTPLLNTIT